MSFQLDANSFIILIAAYALMLLIFCIMLFISIRKSDRRLARVGKVSTPKSQTQVETEAPRHIDATRGEQSGIFARFDSKKLAKVLNFIIPSLDFVRSGIKISRINLATVWLFISALLTAIIGMLLSTGVRANSMIFFALLYIVPRVVLAILSRQVGRSAVRNLPDAIDTLVRNIRSGLPIIEGVKNVAAGPPGPTRDLFKDIVNYVQLGHPIGNAFLLSSARMQSSEYKMLVVSILIQHDTGGNLTDVLQNLSTTLRRREQTRMKIRALSSEAKASAIIIGSLPVLMFVLIGLINPDYISTFFSDARGQYMLFIGVSSMTCGFFTMHQMTRFKL